MTYILHIESSTSVCSVSLAKDGEIIALEESFEGQNHAKLIGIYIEKLLQASKIEASKLSAIAISEGPGSYTGLRIGTSHAKGMCYALNIPLITINPLCAMVEQFLDSEAGKLAKEKKNVILAPMIDARRMEVYTFLYHLENESNSDVIASVINEHHFEDIANDTTIYYFGSGAEKCSNIIAHPNAHYIANIYCSAKSMGKLAYNMFKAEEFANLAYFEPFYLKDFIAGTPKKSVLDQ